MSTIRKLSKLLAGGISNNAVGVALMKSQTLYPQHYNEIAWNLVEIAYGLPLESKYDTMYWKLYKSGLGFNSTLMTQYQISNETSRFVSEIATVDEYYVFWETYLDFGFSIDGFIVYPSVRIRSIIDNNNGNIFHEVRFNVSMFRHTGERKIEEMNKEESKHFKETMKCFFRKVQHDKGVEKKKAFERLEDAALFVRNGLSMFLILLLKL